MKNKKEIKPYSSKKDFKKRFFKAVERDKNSMCTESDKQFLKKLLDMVDENNK